MDVPARIVTLALTVSTNSDAMRLARAGEPAPLWVIAERQTGGRGRSGRAWISEPGNLHASLMIRPVCAAAELPRLSLVAGVAAIDAIRRLDGAERMSPVRLKWPNDLIIGQAKVGGILVETSAFGTDMVAVIGLGLNLARHPAGVPEATSLAAHGVAIAPLDMLTYLASSMDSWLGIWNGGQGFAAIRRAWIARAGGLGERMTVHAGDRRVEGRYGGLDADGALFLDDDAGRRQRFTFGDVTLIQVAKQMR